VLAALVLVGPGKEDDPDLKRAWVAALVQQRMGATALLFGPPPASTREIPDLGQRTGPPPVGHTALDDAEDSAGDGEEDPF
jgi:hypothetical protein